MSISPASVCCNTHVCYSVFNYVAVRCSSPACISCIGHVHTAGCPNHVMRYLEMSWRYVMWLSWCHEMCWDVLMLINVLMLSWCYAMSWCVAMSLWTFDVWCYDMCWCYAMRWCYEMCWCVFDVRCYEISWCVCDVRCYEISWSYAIRGYIFDVISLHQLGKHKATLATCSPSKTSVPGQRLCKCLNKWTFESVALLANLILRRAFINWKNNKQHWLLSALPKSVFQGNNIQCLLDFWIRSIPG